VPSPGTAGGKLLGQRCEQPPRQVAFTGEERGVSCRGEVRW
jgi:hypothetical protein